jgi:hypothetical protein
MGLFDALKSTVFRRGLDDPLVQKGLEKINDIAGGRRREAAKAKWPLASDPDGYDVFSPLLTDEHWALNYLRLHHKYFEPRRADGLDTSGWHFGYGANVMGFDVDVKAGAGGDESRVNDTWVEVHNEPHFGYFSMMGVPELWLEDRERHQRHRLVPDDVDQAQRDIWSGKLRGTDYWVAMTHLDPLIVRVRLDIKYDSRQHALNVLDSVLQRLDMDAFVAWRDDVRAKRGGEDGAEPSAPDTAPADAPTGPPADLSLPDAPTIKASISEALPEHPADGLPADDLGAALGGPLEKVRRITVDGVGSGYRYQSPGGRMLDVLTLDDPARREAVTSRTLPGVDWAWAESNERWTWVELPDDTDRSFGGLIAFADGTVQLVRARGINRMDAAGPVLVVMRSRDT